MIQKRYQCQRLRQLGLWLHNQLLLILLLRTCLQILISYLMPVAFSKDTQKRVSCLNCPVSYMVTSANKCCLDLMNGFYFFFAHVEEFRRIFANRKKKAQLFVALLIVVGCCISMYTFFSLPPHSFHTSS